MAKMKYQKPKVNNGAMRTPVEFFQYRPHKGPEPGEQEKQTIFNCFAEIYNPSMKDLEILNSKTTKQAVTLTIRDPQTDYIVSNKHYVEVMDRRYSGIRWNIVDVRNDFTDNRFITILLAVYDDE
jgi:hypothetical protein